MPRTCAWLVSLSSVTSEHAQTLSLTLTGEDRPGVTSTILGAISATGAEVLDIQQVAVHGHLTLALLLDPGDHTDELRDAAAVAAHRLGLSLTVLEGSGDNARPRHGRAAVVVLGAPLLADAVALVTAQIADHGANIDRIRRLSRYPVTTVEFDISGAFVPSLRNGWPSWRHRQGSTSPLLRAASRDADAASWSSTWTRR